MPQITYRDFDGASCRDVNGTDDGSRTDVETAVTPASVTWISQRSTTPGSGFSSNAGYVEALKAQTSVVSTGAKGFGHPDAEVLARWDAQGDVYRTQDQTNASVDGDVTVTTTGLSFFTVTTSASHVRRSYPLDPSARCPGIEDVAGNHLSGTGSDDVIYGTDGAGVMRARRRRRRTRRQRTRRPQRGRRRRLARGRFQQGPVAGRAWGRCPPRRRRRRPAVRPSPPRSPQRGAGPRPL